MARIETDPNYSSPTFSRATAATDLFKKEDVQALAAAMSTHDHSPGKGVAVPFATAIPNGTITSAMIADATIDTADLKDGAVTSAKIADGTIATADLADRSVTNAKLASDTARANLLTNGGFEIWQRGNGPFGSLSLWTADRWVLTGNPGDTVSVSRDTANTDGGVGACAAVTFTKGSGATLLVQAPANDNTTLYGRILTVSIRVRTSTANAVKIGLYSGSVWTYSGYHTGGGAYQTLTATATLNTGAATGQGQVAIQFDASCTAYLDNAMLVIGNVAADYAPLHPADDLARCLRYYEKIGGDGNAYPNYAAYMATTGQGPYYTLRFMARKAVNPTLTKVGTWAVTNCGQPSVQNGTPDGCSISSNATSNAVYMYFSAPDATTYITAEANP